MDKVTFFKIFSILVSFVVLVSVLSAINSYLVFFAFGIALLFLIYDCIKDEELEDEYQAIIKREQEESC